MNESDPGQLDMFVLYKSPADFPGEYVVRRWSSLPHPVPREIVAHSRSLPAVRAAVPPWLEWLNRMPGDDPSILGAWV